MRAGVRQEIGAQASPQPNTSWPSKTMRRIIGCASNALNPVVGALASSLCVICCALNLIEVAAMLLPAVRPRVRL